MFQYIYPSKFLVALFLFMSTITIVQNLILEQKKCVFVGYSPTQKEYKCLDPISKKVFVSMDVTFLETKSYFCNTHPQWENKSEDLDLVDVFQIVGLGSDDEQPNIGTSRGETLHSVNLLNNLLFLNQP